MKLRYEKLFYDVFSVVFNGEGKVLTDFAGFRMKGELPKSAKRIGDIAEAQAITEGAFELWVEMKKVGKAWVRSGNLYIITKE